MDIEFLPTQANCPLSSCPVCKGTGTTLRGSYIVNELEVGPMGPGPCQECVYQEMVTRIKTEGACAISSYRSEVVTHRVIQDLKKEGFIS